MWFWISMLASWVEAPVIVSWTKVFYFDFQTANIQIPWELIIFSLWDLVFTTVFSGYTVWTISVTQWWSPIWSYNLNNWWTYNWKVKIMITDTDITFAQYNWWWFWVSTIPWTYTTNNATVTKVWPSTLFQSTILINRFYLLSADISDPNSMNMWDVLVYDEFNNYPHTLTVWGQTSAWGWWTNFYAFWWKWWYMNNPSWWSNYLNIYLLNTY